ncbi:DUF3971 domain-containing protein [Pseudooceanicola onchidii]|uniref:YhdP family protein n=1 Tax=Pseudooceanicola onchidii TaxID=2562279 RepID=UPI0010AAB0E9|nr:DUF3971 domain-containing protein [Pseudooceanicola onchidii]
MLSWALAVATGFVLFVFLLTAGLLWTARGHSYSAPAWLKDEVETRIAAALPTVTIQFRDLTLTVSEDWQPSIHLTDLEITPPGRGAPVTLSDITGSFDMAALMDGNLRPRVISVSGSRLHFRRGEDGEYGIAFGSPAGQGPAAEAQAATQIIVDLSDFLNHPTLAALERIEGRAITVRYEDRRSGRAWTLDGGRVDLTRTGDDLRLRADVAVLGGHAYATTGEITITGRMHSPAVSLSMKVEDAAARDIATQSAGLAWLGVLDAPISGALRVTTNADGEIGPLHGTLQIGEGALAPGETRDPVPFQSARTYFRYDPATLTLRFDELTLASAWVEATAEGQIALTDIANGIPEAMTGQLRITELTTNPAGLYPVPLYLEGAEAEMRVKLDPFRLEVGRLDLRDRGQVLAINGWFEAEPEGWDLSLTARADALSADDILELWPATAAAKTREWVARNVLDGTVRNLQLGVRSQPTTRPEVMLGFDFEDLITTFMKTMPPVESASGHAELRGDRFVITADDGWVYAPDGEALHVAGTSFIYRNTRVKAGMADVEVRANGALGDALRLLDLPPLSVLSKANRTPDLATGYVKLAADISLPLIKNVPLDQVQVAYRATLTDVSSDRIVPNQTLSAQTLQIDGDTETLTASGAARLGDIPASGTWTADIRPDSGGRSRFEGTLGVTQALSDQLNLGLPPGAITGEGRARIALEFAKDQAPKFTATSDLAGLGVRVDALNWGISQAQTGAFEIAGSLGTPPVVDRISLTAPGLSAAGTISLRPGGGGLESARFSRVRIGDWLDAPVTLTGRGKAVTPAVAVSGGSVDLRHLDLGKPKGDKGGPISVALDRLQISDTLSLTNLRGDFTTRGGMSGQFTGALNGKSTVQGTIVPRANGSAIRVTSANAGSALSAAGLLKKGRGGELDLTLLPVGPKGAYDGKLTISNIWIQDAPAMASLLSAVSVVGLLEQMSGNGILFTEAQADFRLTPSRVTIRSASAIGASMGVSLDGIYDMAAKAIDLQGVVSPFYALNGIGRIFSRNDGEGLIGFNYRLRGPVAGPRVQVNPLSLFTPGMFREIFRRPPPTTN